MGDGFERSVTGSVGEIRLNRPRARNALRLRDKQAIRDCLLEFDCDPRVRVVVLSSVDPRMFCAGTDIKEMARMDRSEAVRMFDAEASLYAAMLECSTPVVAAISGPAIGGGCILTCSADIAIATPTATFAMPEVSLGVPAPLQTALLPQIIGLARARRMLLLGETYDGQEAERIGLVSEVVAPDRLSARVAEVADRLAARPEKGLGPQKRLIHGWITGGYESSVQLSSLIAAASLTDSTPSEALGRFLEPDPAQGTQLEEPTSGNRESNE